MAACPSASMRCLGARVDGTGTKHAHKGADNAHKGADNAHKGADDANKGAGESASPRAPSRRTRTPTWPSGPSARCHATARSMRHTAPRSGTQNCTTQHAPCGLQQHSHGAMQRAFECAPVPHVRPLVLVLGGRDDHRMPLSPQLQPSAATAGRCAAPRRRGMPLPCDSIHAAEAAPSGGAERTRPHGRCSVRAPPMRLGTAHYGTRGYSGGPDLPLLLRAELLEPATARSASRLGRAGAVHRRKAPATKQSRAVKRIQRKTRRAPNPGACSFRRCARTAYW